MSKSITMGDLEIKFFTTNELSKNEGYTTTPNNSNKIAIWGNKIIEEKEKPKDKNTVAKELGYKSSVNSDIYYNEKDKTYYKWDNNKKTFMLLINAVEIYPNGSYKTESGTLVSYKGESSYLNRKGERIFRTAYGAKMKDESQIRNYMCDIKGLESTRRRGIYFDKNSNSYYQWDSEKRNFVKSEIQDVSQYGDYKKNNKYYASNNKEMSEKEYKAIRSNIAPTSEPDIYMNYSTQKYYRWNDTTKNFEQFDPDAKKKEFLKQKPDGIIESFSQGKQGDCWLLASLMSINSSQKGKELLKEIIKLEENGNITISLKGANKVYTITEEEINAAVKKGTYAFGDKDVVAIELAVEKYRTECAENTDSRNPYSLDYVGSYSPGMMLYGGRTRNALELLTGKKATQIQRANDDNLIMIDNKAIIGKMDENTLKKYFDNPNNVITVSLYTDLNGASGHASQFVKYDEKNVYLKDPESENDELISIPKEEFYKNLYNISYSNLSEPIDKKLSMSRYVKYIMSDEARKYLESKKQ